MKLMRTVTLVLVLLMSTACTVLGNIGPARVEITRGAEGTDGYCHFKGSLSAGSGRVYTPGPSGEPAFSVCGEAGLVVPNVQQGEDRSGLFRGLFDLIW